MTEPTIENWDIGTTAVVTRASPLHETVNEDAAAVIPCGADALVVVVADGMGGMRAGDVASRIAIAAMQEELSPIPADEDMRRLAIIKGFELANDRVQSEVTGGGTTLAVLEFSGRTVRPYHVGDSYMLIVGQRGKIKFENIAHSPVGYALEAGLLNEEEAMHHDDRAIISNMVGSPEMSVDIGPTVTMSARDTALIASDGLSDNLWVQEIVDHIRTRSLDHACHALESLARKRMEDPFEGAPSKPDDLTFALFRPTVSKKK